MYIKEVEKETGRRVSYIWGEGLAVHSGEPDEGENLGLFGRCLCRVFLCELNVHGR